MNLRRNNFPLLFVVILLGIVLVGTPFFFRKNLSVGEFISAVWRIPSLIDENQSLKSEVENLKNEEIETVSENLEIAYPGMHGVPAKIYSLYPFNTKSRIFLGSGSNEGIKKGQPVLASAGTLIGIVFDASPSRSEAITLYDTSFALPVRLGEQEVDALLQGGISPRLTLIDASKNVALGDIVVSASKDMPYGLVVGTVGNVTKDVSGAFFEADIRVSYNLNSLRTAYILLEN